MPFFTWFTKKPIFFMMKLKYADICISIKIQHRITRRISCETINYN